MRAYLWYSAANIEDLWASTEHKLTSDYIFPDDPNTCVCCQAQIMPDEVFCDKCLYDYLDDQGYFE